MAKWHVNPATGEAGKCSAEYSCPFGGSFGGHKNTKREASALYESYRNGLHEPNQSSYFYFISDEEHEFFTWGDCGLLARELNKREGYPVHAIGVRVKGKSEVSWEHMMVKTPDGRFLDVTGIQPEESLKKAWGFQLSLQPNEELVIDELPESRIEEYLGRSKGEKVFPNSDPKATVTKVLEAVNDKF